MRHLTVPALLLVALVVACLPVRAATTPCHADAPRPILCPIVTHNVSINLLQAADSAAAAYRTYPRAADQRTVSADAEQFGRRPPRAVGLRRQATLSA